MTKLLKVSNLNISFKNNLMQDDFHAVHDVEFELNNGEILGIVGESGSGKSITALSLLGLLPYPKAYHSNNSSIKFKGQELINNPNLKEIRGNKIGFVFQEPMSSLNPLHTIEQQIAETIMIHQKVSYFKTRQEVLRLLKLTG
ncbi:MAG: ATP-binding cassette domain-containing protein, partial [Alphaproteobacteria bacterium]|nr:ATP-binding cassette domain-containing protein [Alphaproteobacteria bacterium]